jgi:heterodisulfide reductase subunit A
MYTNKQTIIAKEHSEKPLDTAVFFMDMRTYGKEFEKYYMRAKEEQGVRYIRSKVHTIDPVDNDDLRLRYITEDGELVEETFDMVVLVSAWPPTKESVAWRKRWASISTNTCMPPPTPSPPVSSSKPGVFVCGAFQEPKDIPQSVMEASPPPPRPAGRWRMPEAR